MYCSRSKTKFYQGSSTYQSYRISKNSGHDIGYQLVYTGMEEDPTLENSLFEDLEIAKPDVYLAVDCENLNELTGHVMAKFENISRKSCGCGCSGG